MIVRMMGNAIFMLLDSDLKELKSEKVCNELLLVLRESHHQELNVLISVWHSFSCLSSVLALNIEFGSFCL